MEEGGLLGPSEIPGGGDLYIAFNAHDYFVKSVVPPPPSGKYWYRVVDTNLPSPEDFVVGGVPGVKGVYKMAPYSGVLLHAKP